MRRAFRVGVLCPLSPNGLWYTSHMKQFQRVGEATLDARKRISLGKAGAIEESRYEISVSDDGDILLTPLASIPARELILWERPDLMQALDEGIADALAGRIVPLRRLPEFDDD